MHGSFLFPGPPNFGMSRQVLHTPHSGDRHASHLLHLDRRRLESTSPTDGRCCCSCGGGEGSGVGGGGSGPGGTVFEGWVLDAVKAGAARDV